jgi:flagellar basal-body rod modification protein FlgD
MIDGPRNSRVIRQQLLHSKLPRPIFDRSLTPLPNSGSMTTTAVNNTKQGNQLASPSASSKMSLKTEDFIKMMITQLQNQDPLEPAKNEQLLAQMSQIGQLQSSTQLTASLKGLVLQNSLGSAGNMIGKMVRGMDDQNETISGLVNSVRVESDKVYLELDSGKSLELTRVTSIAGASGGVGSPTTTPTPTPTPTTSSPK